MIFVAPELSPEETVVLAWIAEVRREMRYLASGPQRWTGLLRRLAFARAVQASNSIEGYHVSLDDALASYDRTEVLDADEVSRAAVNGYQEAMTYIVRLADDPHASLSLDLIRGLHYMMMSHNLDKRPGQWRTGPVYVVSAARGKVYEGPDSGLVPGLMEALAESLLSNDGESVTVRAAMAHLNLVMIHPFKDGNGRMSRALQTLVLAREGIVAPIFCSVEEYLGHNQQAYYNVLAEVGGGSWQPERSASAWVRFMLVAHYRQALTLQRRGRIMQVLWDEMEQRLAEAGLPSHALPIVCEAARGARIRRATYMSLADVEVATASRHLKLLTDGGFLVAAGERRGRAYRASDVLTQQYEAIEEAIPRGHNDDPFQRVQEGQALGLASL